MFAKLNVIFFFFLGGGQLPSGVTGGQGCAFLSTSFHSVTSDARSVIVILLIFSAICHYDLVFLLECVFHPCTFHRSGQPQILRTHGYWHNLEAQWVLLQSLTLVERCTLKKTKKDAWHSCFLKKSLLSLYSEVSIHEVGRADFGGRRKNELTSNIAPYPRKRQTFRCR